MLVNKRLNLSFGKLNRSADAVLALGALRSRALLFEQALDQLRDEIAAGERLDTDPSMRKMGLHGVVNESGDIAALQHGSLTCLNFVAKHHQELFSRAGKPRRYPAIRN